MEGELGADFLVREQALAIRQARGQVAIQVFVLAACLALWMLLGFPRRLAWTVGIVVAGALATVADVRWWLWLREATPTDAYERLQSRSEQDGAAVRPWLTRILSIGLFATWWVLGH